MNDQEQLEFCQILDDWYLEIKPRFEGQHPLGMCKEDLKSKVCAWLQTKTFTKHIRCIRCGMKPLRSLTSKGYCKECDTEVNK